MAVSSVPTHLSREMSDYGCRLWCAVPPAVATCTAKSRPPPLDSLSHSLKPCQRYEPVYLHCGSTVIYYTSIVMKTYLIHNVYCGRKMARQPKEQTITAALTKTCVICANRGRKGTFYYCLRLLEGWHVQLTLHETTFPLLSIPRKHIYHITLTEVKGWAEHKPK